MHGASSPPRPGHPSRRHRALRPRATRAPPRMPPKNAHWRRCLSYGSEAHAVEALSLEELPGSQRFATRQLQPEDSQDSRTADDIDALVRCAEHGSRYRLATQPGRSDGPGRGDGLGIPNPQLLPVQLSLRHRPGIEGADLAMNMFGALLPVDQRFRLVDLGSVRDALSRLSNLADEPRAHGMQRFIDELRTHVREPVVQRLGRV